MAAGAGAQWEKLKVPTAASLRGLSVVSGDVVWASGSDGTVIRTIDGGEHWAVIKVTGAEKLDFRGIRAFDQKTAVIISSGPAENGQARIYRTNDGGESWQQVFEQKRKGLFFDAIAFWDRRHGIVLSDPVDGKFAFFVTDDSGATWKQLSSASLPEALPNEGAFAASNSCLIVEGQSNVWFATGGAKVARVFRSVDRGRTWSVAETPMHPPNASSGIFSLAFLDSKNGTAVGGDYAHPESSELPNVMNSHDGGRTWKADTPTDPAGVYLSSVSILVSPDGAVFIAVGTKGAFLLPADLHILHAHPGWGDLKLNSIAVADKPPVVLWAVGPAGTVTILRSTNELRRK